MPDLKNDVKFLLKTLQQTINIFVYEELGSSFDNLPNIETRLEAPQHNYKYNIKARLQKLSDIRESLSNKFTLKCLIDIVNFYGTEIGLGNGVQIESKRRMLEILSNFDTSLTEPNNGKSSINVRLMRKYDGNYSVKELKEIEEKIKVLEELPKIKKQIDELNKDTLLQELKKRLFELVKFTERIVSGKIESINEFYELKKAFQALIK